MRIFHVIFSFNTGGAETMLVDILNEQSKLHDVHLLVINDSVELNLLRSINKKVRVHLIGRKPGSFSIFRLIYLNVVIFKNRPDVIHCHSLKAGRLIKVRDKALKCLTIHDVNFPTNDLNRYNKLFSISKTVANDIVRRDGPKSTIVYNGVDFERIVARETAFSVDSVFRIVQISRLDHSKKGQDVLIKALAILVKEKGVSKIQLDLIGDGPSEKCLRDLALFLGVDKNVNFLGNKDRSFIYSQLSKYNVLVQPSIYEGFGLTVVEGMAAKIPVLVSDIDGPIEIIRNGNYGFSFAVGDAEDCADQILKVMRCVNRAFLEAAHSFAKSTFDIKSTSAAYLFHYHQTENSIN